MAPAFAFPPPPPPPPKRQQDSAAPYGSQGRGFSSAARRRGRGRGETHASAANALPTGTYVNPNFQPVQRQASYARQYDTSQTTQPVSGHAASTYPDRSAAGHKRKLDVLRGAVQAQADRPRSNIAPTVPSFGAPLNNETAAGTGAEPVRKPGKSLFGSGVTQDEPEYSDSEDAAHEDAEDDDADEEAAYAQLGNKLVFEYEGQIVKLTSEQDLARWQDERRKKFPTTDRVAVKEAQRRVTGDERKRLLSAAYMLRRPDWRAAIDRLSMVATQDEVETTTDPADSAGVVAKTSGLGLGVYDSDDEEDEAPISKVESQEADGSDDDPPEAISAKIKKPQDNRPACKFFFANGRCKEGESCSYRHEARSDQPLDLQSSRKRDKPRQIIVKDKSKKRGIHQVLVDQENVAGDKLALQVIKYLGSIGFFTPAE